MKAFTETTLSNLFLNRAYRFSDKPFLHYKVDSEWKHWTWKEFALRVEMIARGLMAIGVKKGMHICLMAENCPEWAMFDLAILSIGAVTVPIYATTEIDQAGHIVKHSDAHTMIVSTKTLLEQIRNQPTTSGIKNWISFEKAENALSIDAIVEKANKVDVSEYYQHIAAIQPSDIATIVYTSGTTGDPKGVMLTHENILSNTIYSAKLIQIHHKDISLSFLPLSHMFERMAGFFCFIYFGAEIFFAENLQKIPENLLEVRPTVFITVPRMLEKFYNKVHENMESRSAIVRKMFNHAFKTNNPLFLKLYSKLFFQKIRARMGGRIRFVVSGGAALTPSIARFFDKAGIPILQGYGLTETSPVISFNPLEDNRIGTVGHVLENLEVKLTDDSEILVKGPSIMMGYYKNEKATKEAFTEDGFFKTGDIGELDHNILKITDRKKELIVTSGGKKVAPQPIENELLHHPIIDQVCLVGEGMKTIGALIVPNQSYLMKTASQLHILDDYPKLLERKEIHQQFQSVIDQVNQRLSSYQQIKNFKLLVHPFSQENHELTPTMKLRRKNIFQHYDKDIQSLFENSSAD